jgi:hypothetical protein
MSWKNYFQRNESSRLASRKGMISHKGMISLRELQSAGAFAGVHPDAGRI